MKNHYLYHLDDIPQKSKIALYGSGETGEAFFLFLKEKRPDVQVTCFLDSFKNGEKCGLQVISIEQSSEILKKTNYIVVTSAFWNQIEIKLISMGINNFFILSNYFIYITSQLKYLGDFYFQDNNWEKTEKKMQSVLEFFSTQEEKELYQALFLLHREGNSAGMDFLKSKCYSGKQYLDYINYSSIRTIIEGGVFDGSDTIELYERIKKDGRLIGFEPFYQKALQGVNEKFFKSTSAVQIYPYALWNKQEQLSFYVNESGSSLTGGINRQEELKVMAVRLDDFVKEQKINKVDYLKMDIEGAETAALEGAAETIRNHRPQIAVSIYHKKEHLYEIPLFLKELIPDSRCHLGQYTASFVDSVFYLIPNEIAEVGK